MCVCVQMREKKFNFEIFIVMYEASFKVHKITKDKFLKLNNDI
jgi:hypothetical protein